MVWNFSISKQRSIPASYFIIEKPKTANFQKSIFWPFTKSLCDRKKQTVVAPAAYTSGAPYRLILPGPAVAVAAPPRSLCGKLKSDLPPEYLWRIRRRYRRLRLFPNFLPPAATPPAQLKTVKKQTACWADPVSTSPDVVNLLVIGVIPAVLDFSHSRKTTSDHLLVNI